MESIRGGNMDRMGYAEARRERYLDWCARVADSPYTAIEKLEFAIISAHTPQAVAIAGFLRSRGCEGEEIAKALSYEGVLGAYNKGWAVYQLRQSGVQLPLDGWAFPAYRRGNKLLGLGYCKLSFGLALTAPLTSQVVCLDTHLCQAYGATFSVIARKLDAYEEVEGRLKREAQEVGLPPFAYQWAVWDYQRGRAYPTPHEPDDHSFLWRGGALTGRQALW